MNIGEAASQSGVSAKMICHYEETGIVPKPARTFSNYRRYDANDVGFGFVDNADLGTPDAASVQIRYPDQSYSKVSLGYRASALGAPIADRVEITGYRSVNTRTFTLDVFAPFGPGTPAGAGVQINTRNFTDIGTTGFRAEAAKVLGSHVLTYGIDFFRDRSDNTDSSTTTVSGFGPPRTTVSDSTLTPNASFRSIGIFAQGELALTERLLAVLGARWQGVRALTRPTPRTSAPAARASDHALVGAANLSYRVLPGVSLVGTVGRAFRSPNLIERFFLAQCPDISRHFIPSQLMFVKIGGEGFEGLTICCYRFGLLLSAHPFGFGKLIPDGHANAPHFHQCYAENDHPEPVFGINEKWQVES